MTDLATSVDRPASAGVPESADYIARYGEAPTGRLPSNPVLDTLLQHRSVRSFLPDALPEGALEAIVAAASSAPTSSNIQAWSVVAVEDPARKARLAEIAGGQQHIIDAPLILVFIADLARAERIGAGRGKAMEGLDYTESFLLASIDAALAAQNALVAAESLGLGTVYIGALRNQPEKLAAELGLPPRSYGVFGLVLGHPDPAVATAVKPRLPQAAVLHRERYATDDAAAIAAHDRHALDFRAGQGLSAQSWSDLVIDRLGTVAALKGRHLLREALQRLGFAQK